MTFNRLMTGAAVAVAAICFGAALVAADRDTSREFLEVTGFDVAITSLQQGAMNGPGIAGSDPDAFGSEWVRLAREIFEPEAMIEETLDMMEAIMPQDLVDHGIAFYETELGQRLVEAENAAQMNDPDTQYAEGELIVTRLADENPARINEYRLMSDAIGGVDSSVRAVIELQVRYLTSAMAAGASDIQYSEAELREILKDQEPQLREAIQSSGILASAYVYRDFSDDDVVAYREALEDPEMMQVYEILNGIQYEIMGDRYAKLAARLSDLAPQQDI
ncbi:DUF2059 domain-containing protein [Maritimibacter sp. DP1N21-5]|uniref:DUF2059 domain-containing protein n=1 Tax=Maritimibacter sp. DP1N21-5 TaxID=2836867 RepID=UPI001C44ECE9|nr:DUF2059 domain-containing protein [Maritimibacter sp. DP1N21-5]MBV7409532.1 DUF2059 domain-containing protein [Maritimibacter sp. DP1N21-5]